MPGALSYTIHVRHLDVHIREQLLERGLMADHIWNSMESAVQLLL